MKYTLFGAALISAVNACMVDGDCGCALPKDFHHHQRQVFNDYDNHCKQNGYANELTQYKYDPYAPQKSPYAYADYIPGENPYLGRWKRDTRGECYKSYKEAIKSSHITTPMKRVHDHNEAYYKPSTYKAPAKYGYDGDKSYSKTSYKTESYVYPQKQKAVYQPSHYKEVKNPLYSDKTYEKPQYHPQYRTEPYEDHSYGKSQYDAYKHDYDKKDYHEPSYGYKETPYKQEYSYKEETYKNEPYKHDTY